MASLANHQYRADTIAHYYRAHGCDRLGTVKHFIEQKVPRATIYRAIKTIEMNGNCKFRPISGRPKTKTVERAKKVIDRKLERKPDTSVRELARISQVSVGTAFNLKKELHYNCYTKQPTSKTTVNQEERIKRGARKLYEKLIPSGGEKIVVMDDETYVFQDPSEIPGKQFYNEKPGRPVPHTDKFKRKTKFAKKFLVWQAIDQHGNVSAPFISQGTINGDVYLNECLKKRLLPFIAKNHNVEEVLFWPDMARAHYATQVTDWLKSQNIDFVSHSENTPNFPAGRPIEKFWALCKSLYRQTKQMPKSVESFRRVWSKVSEKVAKESGKSLMAGLKLKLRLGAAHGSIGPLLPRQSLNSRRNSSQM